MTTGAKLFRAVAMVVALATVTALPAHAVNKDMVQLQTQMQALQDAIARLQQSNDERMGVLKDLVQQTSDSVNKMSLEMGTIKNQMDRQTEAAKTKEDGLAGQIQGLNDSLDELRARMDKMQKMLGDVQGQQAQTNAMLSAGVPAAGGASAAPATTAPPTATPAPAAPITRQPNPAAGSAQPGEPLPMPDEAAPAASHAAAGGDAAAAVPVADMYRNAYSDYMSGKTALATGEFTDVIKAYPDDNLAGNAYFYLGDIDLKANKSSSAIKNYDHTIEHYPNNAKIPQAQLHKAQALLAMGQKQSAALELRALIQRYPTSPEAAQAKTRLATISPRR